MRGSEGVGGNITALFTGSASSSMYLQRSSLQQFFVGHYAEVSFVSALLFER